MHWVGKVGTWWLRLGDGSAGDCISPFPILSSDSTWLGESWAADSTCPTFPEMKPFKPRKRKTVERLILNQLSVWSRRQCLHHEMEIWVPKFIGNALWINICEVNEAGFGRGRSWTQYGQHGCSRGLSWPRSSGAGVAPLGHAPARSEAGVPPYTHIQDQFSEEDHPWDEAWPQTRQFSFPALPELETRVQVTHHSIYHCQFYMYWQNYSETARSPWDDKSPNDKYPPEKETSFWSSLIKNGWILWNRWL